MPGWYIDDMIAEKEAELHELEHTSHRPQTRSSFAKLQVRKGALLRELDDLRRKRDSGIYARRPPAEKPD